MAKLDDYRLTLKSKLYVPIIIGGMGVDISTADLALEAARLGGIGHISDAMSPYLSDKKFGTHYQATKAKLFKAEQEKNPAALTKWSKEMTYESSKAHAADTMSRKRGDGAVFVNVMERLTMGDPVETMQARLAGALDGGIDGITLSAGLHNASLRLIEDHPRFRDANIGIIVSSLRALKIFLRGAKRVDRMPDYVVVEGPLAGGHLGFGSDWASHNLKDIVAEIIQFIKEEGLNIAVIPAGGIFTGTNAVEYMDLGAGGVQVATRFTISKECGFPEHVKQVYINAGESDVEVNTSSPTGYAMRMLKSSPSKCSKVRPNCAPLGYLLDKDGNCSYKDAWENAPLNAKGERDPIGDKMCICHYFMRYECYTCGHYVYRLKETTTKLADGSYYIPPMEDIFNDYRYSEEYKIILPKTEEERAKKVVGA